MMSARCWTSSPALKGVHGRLELVGQTAAKAPVFVDYAHTPDGLNVLLRAARPHVRGKLIVVFGCGGDRDATKRPIMGDVARQAGRRGNRHRRQSALGRRREDPRRCPQGAPDCQRNRRPRRCDRRRRAEAPEGRRCAADRRCKGHETGQIVKGVTIPFSDFDVARKALAEAGQ